MIDVKEVADEADMIISGYAFTKSGDRVRILNLNHPSRAAVLSLNGEIIEASMPDIELAIVSDYYNNSRQFMEV